MFSCLILNFLAKTKKKKKKNENRKHKKIDISLEPCLTLLMKAGKGFN